MHNAITLLLFNEKHFALIFIVCSAEQFIYLPEKNSNKYIQTDTQCTKMGVKEMKKVIFREFQYLQAAKKYYLQVVNQLRRNVSSTLYIDI